MNDDFFIDVIVLDGFDVIVEICIWLEQIVIGLNLCFFVKVVYVKNQVCFVFSDVIMFEVLVEQLVEELVLLCDMFVEQIDIMLIVYLDVFIDFLDYNDFFDNVDVVIEVFDLQGILQVVSFYLQYQFVGVVLDDVSNYINCVFYLILYLFCEDSVECVVVVFFDLDVIVECNIEIFDKFGVEGWICLFGCKDILLCY